MATIGTRDEQHRRFWDVAEPYLEAGALVEGTMMGHQCLRSAGSNGFVATVERASGNLVVKLPGERVAGLIATGEGEPFAPAKKVFREWVAIPEYDAQRWSELLEESMEFVDG